MTTPMVLVATWRDGLFVVADDTLDHELRDQPVRALAPDGRGGALAIVNGRSLRRRAPNGVWSPIATTELAFSDMRVLVGKYLATYED